MTTKHYDECYFVNYDSYDDLNFYEVGCQKCPPGYSFGPIIRDNYVLHYVLSGEGKLYLNDKEYPVSEKQVFVLPPNFLVYYKGSKQNPWNYIWIHFNGKKAIDLLSQAGITSESQFSDRSPPVRNWKTVCWICCITTIRNTGVSETYTNFFSFSLLSIRTSLRLQSLISPCAM